MSGTIVKRRKKSDRLSLNDLKLDLCGLSPDELLRNWRWFIGEDKYLLFATVSGDAFLVDYLGRVYWLETGAGTLSKVAEDQESFLTALEQEDRRNDWLFAENIASWIRAGQTPNPGECFGYKSLPVLGGTYEESNRLLVKASEHFWLSGEIHFQIKDLPDGARVRIKIED